MSDWVIDVIDAGGYLGLAALMFLECVFPPIPSEAILPFVGFAVAEGTLSFPLVIIAATAGSIRLFDDKGEPQADIAYNSYQIDGADRASRPVTFLFNGGPGAASAWLQFGAAGPWRLRVRSLCRPARSAPWPARSSISAS